MNNLNIEYDNVNDILTIEGIRYSGQLFREVAACYFPKQLEIIDRKDGVLVLRTLPTL